MAIGFLAGLSVSAEARNLAQNYSFEEGMAPWFWSASGNCRATGEIDDSESHGGRRSFRMTNQSAAAPNVYARLGQKLRGLKPDTTYRISVWCKAVNAVAANIVGGPGWVDRGALPRGAYDWRQVTMDFKTRPADTTYDLGFTVEAPVESIWIDDDEVYEYDNEDYDDFNYDHYYYS